MVNLSTSRIRAIMGTVGRYTFALASLKPTVAYTAENGIRQSPGTETRRVFSVIFLLVHVGVAQAVGASRMHQ